MSRAEALEIPESVESWWDDYARHLRRKRRKPATVRLHRKAFEKFWTWAANPEEAPERQVVVDPNDVTTDTINRWTESLQEAGLASATVSIDWRSLSPFWTWWAAEADRPNPFDNADTPTVDVVPPPVIDQDDVRALLATCSGKSFDDRRDSAILRVLFDTGVRLGELSGMRLDGWDRRNDYLTIDGKSGPRVVPMSPSTGEALARYVRQRNQHRMADSPALWLGRKGALKDSAFNQLLARRCRQAGLSRLHPHLFRHTWAHEYRVAGGTEGDLMYLAGWKSPLMAHRYGKSAAAERAREAAQRIKLGDRL